MSLPCLKLFNTFLSYLHQDPQAPHHGQQSPTRHDLGLLSHLPSPYFPPGSPGSTSTASLLSLKLPKPALALAPTAPFAWKGWLHIFVWFLPSLVSRPSWNITSSENSDHSHSLCPTPSFALYPPNWTYLFRFRVPYTTWHYIFVCACSPCGLSVSATRTQKVPEDKEMPWAKNSASHVRGTQILAERMNSTHICWGPILGKDTVI